MRPKYIPERKIGKKGGEKCKVNSLRCCWFRRCSSRPAAEAAPVRRGSPNSRAPGDAGEPVPAVTIGEPRIPSETEPGYKSTVIEPPHWAGELGSGAVLGDVFYILAETGEGAQAAAAYDTISGAVAAL